MTDDPDRPSNPDSGDLASPFLFVPHGAPEPVEWMRKHPGWVKFPATFVPRAPAAVRTIPGTNRPWPLDERGQPWPRSRFGQPLRPLDEYPPGVRAPGEGYTGPIADPDAAMRAAMASRDVSAQAAKFAADPDAPIRAYLSAMEVWKDPGKYAGYPRPEATRAPSQAERDADAIQAGINRVRVAGRGEAVRVAANTPVTLSDATGLPGLDYLDAAGRPLAPATGGARHSGTTVNLGSDLGPLGALVSRPMQEAWDRLPVPARAPAFGTLSSRYETGGRGIATISTGIGDPGGISYGSYQMSSQPAGGTVGRFVRDPAFPWRDRFAGLTPGTPAFTERWRALAMEAPRALFEAQHEFVGRTHYEPLVQRTAAQDRLDISTRSRALQDAVWSTAVQNGPGTPIIHRAIQRLGSQVDPTDPQLDRRLIGAIYAERGRRDDDGRLVYFRSSSPAVQAGLVRRFDAEERDALRMLADGR